MQSFRVIERQKVRAKHKFVNRYSATKSPVDTQRRVNVVRYRKMSYRR